MVWSWIWPSVGPTPINQGLDSEMFDRVDYPYSETFVREAIQNSLDARLDPDEPVTIRFMFHEDKLAKGSRFLEKAVSYRETAGLGVPEEWYSDKIKWLTVEDSTPRACSATLATARGISGATGSISAFRIRPVRDVVAAASVASLS